MSEEPLCIVCCKRVANVMRVCSSCAASHDSTTGDRLSLKQRQVRLEEVRPVDPPRDIFRTERTR